MPAHISWCVLHARAFCAGLLVFSFAARVRADAGPLPFLVHATGRTTECEDAGGFSVEIRQRSRRLHPALANEPALDFSLELGGSGRAFSGRLRVRELDGTETSRAITGVSCDEVLSALALIAVVLVDPNAASEPPRPEPRTEPQAPHVAPRSAPARPWGFAAGIGVGLEGAVAPDLLLSASVQGEVALAGSGVWSPRVALALSHSFPDEVSASAGVAHFQWTAARLSSCPVRYPSSGPFALRPCLSFDAGRLAVTGDQTYHGQTARVAWFALGGAARTELRLLSTLLLGLDAGFIVPFTRDSFFFELPGQVETLRGPKIGLTLGLSVAAHFE